MAVKEKLMENKVNSYVRVHNQDKSNNDGKQGRWKKKKKQQKLEHAIENYKHFCE